MTLPLYDLIENSVEYIEGPAFMGIGVGPDGVPIDLVRVHLLGEKLKNYTVLVADEFSSRRIAGENGLSDADLVHALGKYDKVFDLFSNIWPNQNSFLRASKVMSDPRFEEVYWDVERKLKEEDLEDEVHNIQTERGEREEDRWRFAVNELSVIEFLARHYNMEIKVGPHSEMKYDNVMRRLSPNMRFHYLHSSRGLTDRRGEPSPYSVANIQAIGNRILINDEPDTVEEKLRLANPDAQKYFANLGSLARRAAGNTRHVPRREEIARMSQEEVLEFAQDSVVGSIIAPFRRAQGISVYGETPMRRIYDQTLPRAKVLLHGRTPNLGTVVRPELDSIGKQLLALLTERTNFSFDSGIYNGEYPHLREAGVLREVPANLYAPLLNILGVNGSNQELPLGVDLEIMGLLQRRLETSYQVAVAKLKSGKSVYDGEREEKVIEAMVQGSLDYEGLDPQKVDKSIRFIMDTSKEIQDIIISRFWLDFNDRVN